jgi:flagellin-like hook-associated protein FlgL
MRSRVAFSVNTNIASLQAQDYLRITSDSQGKTINRVTSGLRIISSGDDAAGLAVANGFRSDQAMLSQGIRNANDGMSTLQTLDGGMNDISQLLDRARSLATQSASDTFNGDRQVLNSEFQSVMDEIDRQAASIGLNRSGAFAKVLSVFIGGGRGVDDDAAIENGSVTVDLSHSTIDTKSLSLHSLDTAAPAGADLTAAQRSVSDIIAANPPAGPANFTFAGAGFTAGVQVSVDLTGVYDQQTLVDAINTAIQSQPATSAASAAFASAGITASVSSDNKSLVFRAGDTPFQIEAGNAKAAAFLGFQGAPGVGNLTGNPRLESGGVQTSTVFDFTPLNSPDTQMLTFSATDSAGQLQSVAVPITGTLTTPRDILSAVNNALQASQYTTLQNIVAVNQSLAGPPVDVKLRFISSDPSFSVNLGPATGAGGGIATAAGDQDIIENSQSSDGLFGESSTVDISEARTAKAAVNVLAEAVKKLGDAQAVVGRGENQLNYAVNLAQSQMTNLAAAESRIRDADLAQEAANLTKAQILIQAGTVALAQANSAPQAILSLLKS